MFAHEEFERVNESLQHTDFLDKFRYQDFSDAAHEFISTFSPEQQKKLVLDFDNEYRTRGFCSVVAGCPDDYEGIKLHDFTPEQKIAFHKMMSKLLSEYGYRNMVEVFNRQLIIGEMEDATRNDPQNYTFLGDKKGGSVKNWKPPKMRSSDDYYVAFFGKVDQVPFGIRVEGHHLSLNYTFLQSKDPLIISTSPTFYGSTPMIVLRAPTSTPEKYPHWQLQVGQTFMLSETQLTKKLISSLSKTQKMEALTPEMASPFLEGGLDQKPDIKKYMDPQYPGVMSQNLTNEQKYLLEEVLKLIASWQRPEFLNIQELLSDLDVFKISYYGDTGDLDQFYFRAQSPRFLIELVQSQNFSVLDRPKDIHHNHVHIMFRDLRHDWGYDVLGQHLKHDHTPKK